ncbi:DUF2935 domain-containing protein [Porcipelethomonas sp.]|uniref:DUF2935 domain-containing protein n=1 Tax=Porcipelethomonas sp. TaxID=2981675 RepID=UPI003EF6C3DB
MNINNYIAESLELHIFFGRIMKEHSLFLKAGFTPANSNFSAKSEFYKNEFENLLNRTVLLSKGIISPKVLNSGEIVTEFTLDAERQTEKFTGIHINSNITRRELRLSCCDRNEISGRIRQVKALNRTALRLLNGLISLKEEILNKMLSCQMFTVNYPLLIEHILREAKLYRDYINMLETEGTIIKSMKEVECFWNQIMMEHALFIRGLLDPTETELIHSADMFADNYAALLKNCRNAQNKTMNIDSMTETKKLRDFKAAGAKGIENCQIRSIILPLLADHVLREANHFIRILES